LPAPPPGRHGARRAGPRPRAPPRGTARRARRPRSQRGSAETGLLSSSSPRGECSGRWEGGPGRDLPGGHSRMGADLKVLGERSREVLASVVSAYIRSAAPVSSRQLTKTGGFGLSSASLRNAMADLEDLGLLMHPHVSAGRIPTDRGYRAFVDELMLT